MKWRWPWSMAVAVGASAWTASEAYAQSSSLYGSPQARPGLTLAGESWLFVQPEPIRQIQINDLVTVMVNETSQVLTEGEVQRRTQSSMDARLRNWIKLDGFGIKKAPQAGGEPRARGSYDAQYNTTAEVQTQDKMVFKLQVRVVDIRPNGNLVLEGHQVIQNNDEIQEISLTGVCRREDVNPQNQVQSEDIYEKKILKREAGSVRDAYRRGWFTRSFDQFKPF